MAETFKERPILFSGEMVRAILDGRKTQTRRVVKPQPPTVEGVKRKAGIGYGWMQSPFKDDHFIVTGPVWAYRELVGERANSYIKCPYGKVGDRLWVRETQRFDEESAKNQNMPMPFVFYMADGNLDSVASNVKWRPSIHMPRWASRINLEIIDIRVERVQDITIDDVVAEGIANDPDVLTCKKEGSILSNSGLKVCFEALWDKINSDRGFGWDVNPWVWVVEFEAEEAQS